MTDQMRADWAMVVSLAEGLSDRPRAVKNAGDRLWAGIEDLRARVAELEAVAPEASTQWGACRVGYVADSVPFRDESMARWYVNSRRGRLLTQRDVYEPGPWRETT